MILKAVAGPGVAGMRLDDGARALFPILSKGRIRKAIEWGGCRIAGTVVRVASRHLRAGDAITIGVTDGEEPFRELTIGGTDILRDDAEYLAVNKPEGVYCQRTPYQLKGTVEFAVGRLLRSSGIAEPVRIVHRLDRGTSGVMVFPKTRRAAAHLSERLKAGAVEKVYWALVPARDGADAWTVDAPVAALGKSRFGVGPGGREARTAFRVLADGDGATLVEARPLSGRTHQIRVHLAHGGHPVVGDDRYGGLPAPRLMLHCRRMAFDAADGRRIEATAPPDRAFADGCARLGIPLRKRRPPAGRPLPGGPACVRGHNNRRNN